MTRKLDIGHLSILTAGREGSVKGLLHRSLISQLGSVL